MFTYFIIEHNYTVAISMYLYLLFPLFLLWLYYIPNEKNLPTLLNCYQKSINKNVFKKIHNKWQDWEKIQ